MNILVCIDGTKKSEEVLRYAGEFAKIFDANVTVLYVFKEHRSMFESAIKHSRTQIKEWGLMRPGAIHLKSAYNILKEMGVGYKKSQEAQEILNKSEKGGYDMVIASCLLRGINLRLREGKVAEEILRETETGDYDLLVMGAPEMSGIGKTIFGSVSHKVVENAKIPVLIAPKIIYHPRFSILICTDGSRAINQAIERISDKLKILNPDKITVLSVSPDDKDVSHCKNTAEETAEILRTLGLNVETRVRVGKPADEILKEAKNDYAMVIVCSHRLRHKNLLLGSVSSDVIAHNEVPTIVMK